MKSENLLITDLNYCDKMSFSDSISKYFIKYFTIYADQQYCHIYIYLAVFNKFNIRKILAS